MVYVANDPKITCAKFGVKLFVRARDTAANIMYYVMVRSYVESRLPVKHCFLGFFKHKLGVKSNF